MKGPLKIFVFLALATFVVGGCTTYKAKPLPFKTPAAYANMVDVEGVQVAGAAYTDKKDAENAFGFDIRAAGMLPVQLVFDNQGAKTLEINPQQTFLEDADGNLWPILSDRFAYERATRYAQTKQIFKEGAYYGMLGAVAGSLIGAAVGVVSGEDVASALGKGAAVGAAAGATIGGAKGLTSEDARREITRDLREKSLENRPIAPNQLAYGIIFFPGEAASAKQLRLQLLEVDSERSHSVLLKF